MSGRRNHEHNTENEQVLLSKSEEETIAIGGKVAEQLKNGSIVAIIGELGSGKTRMVQGICYRLGVREEVTSPTFTLINEYHGRLPVYHFDFYRIKNHDEYWQLGCEEYFYSEGVSLLEWADKVIDMLPAERITIRMQGFFNIGQENQRQVTISGLLNTIII